MQHWGTRYSFSIESDVTSVAGFCMEQPDTRSVVNIHIVYIHPIVGETVHLQCVEVSCDYQATLAHLSLLCSSSQACQGFD